MRTTFHVCLHLAVYLDSLLERQLSITHLKSRLSPLKVGLILLFLLLDNWQVKIAEVALLELLVYIYGSYVDRIWQHIVALQLLLQLLYVFERASDTFTDLLDLSHISSRFLNLAPHLLQRLGQL